MQVIVDLFSGVPNPQWELSPEEESEFIRFFQELPERQDQSMTEDGLGYNGLIVTDIEPYMEKYREIVVFNGWAIAKHKHPSRVTSLLDQGRKLEKWLLQTGEGRLERALYRQIMQGVQDNPMSH